ncbi:MAG: undecaprenyl-diphosphate phosphatase [Parvibaculales bacterium]
MTFTHIFALAIIQGITEFLPVSSSGHLNLLHLLTDLPDQGVGFDVALHAGTLLAVLVYFREDVASVMHGLLDFTQGRDSANRHLAFQLALASLPVLMVAGILVLTGWVDILRSPKIIAIASIVFALPLYLTDRFCQQSNKIENLRLPKALLIGLAQVFALIPGASRAGVTITAGRLLGLERAQAARFSMLLSMPVIGSFTLLGLVDVLASQNHAGLQSMLIGAGLAALFAFLSIHVFMKMTARFSLLPFVLYRLALGGLVLWLIA